MSDDLREQIEQDADVVAAEDSMREASAELLEACTGTGPLRTDRLTREERTVLQAAQAYRNAENARNRAVADAVRRLLS